MAVTDAMLMLSRIGACVIWEDIEPGRRRKRTRQLSLADFAEHVGID
jgi:hypothetical protein